MSNLFDKLIEGMKDPTWKKTSFAASQGLHPNVVDEILEAGLKKGTVVRLGILDLVPVAVIDFWEQSLREFFGNKVFGVAEARTHIGRGRQMTFDLLVRLTQKRVLERVDGQFRFIDSGEELS